MRFNFNDKIDFKRDLNSFPKLAKMDMEFPFQKVRSKVKKCDL
ncbi:hypothetical protein LEP1GSC005_3291 [Leptospira santarosai str. ST188]|nr:hypothetical protein LEP1GSC068_2583 [Leptospira sp. Fiocruz LV3954]EMF92633.1 hypothetical protein LEP1GSC005_3291 [Leptospira santarosai str. ST188]EMI64705.1 hypothetical protein LEP1GSC076_3260 [Leptospira sp. Fiocruz LV4135]EMO14022.1 hypothetical protein LEP1GSC165_3397 [Leptospira santarosai str. CBC523]